MLEPVAYQSKAIVLLSTRYKEDSAIITLVGEKGLFSLLARGIYKMKSPLKPLLISGSLVYVEFRKSSEISFASSVKVLWDSSELLTSYVSSLYLMYLEELCLSLYQFDDPFPFDEILRIVQSLRNGDTLSLTLLTLGVLYRSLGIGLETQRCVRCKKTRNIVGYSFQDGGFLCKDCIREGDTLATDRNDLYVLKFTFHPLDEEILSKKVFHENGMRMLCLLNDRLLSCFDLKKTKSFPLLLSALE